MAVIVRDPLVIELASMMMASWGNGTLAPDAPPLVSAHDAVVFQLPPSTSTQYRVTGVVVVILVFPSASPRTEPVHGIDAPAAAISEKSTFDTVATAALMVVLVPIAELWTYRREVAFVPVSVSVPLTVCVVPAEKLSPADVVDDPPVAVSAPNVLLPVTEINPVGAKVTVPYVRPPLAKVYEPVPVMLIVALAQENVRFVIVVAPHTAPLVPLKLIVAAPQVSARVAVPVTLNVAAPTVAPLRSSVPVNAPMVIDVTVGL